MPLTIYLAEFQAPGWTGFFVMILYHYDIFMGPFSSVPNIGGNVSFPLEKNLAFPLLPVINAEKKS